MGERKINLSKHTCSTAYDQQQSMTYDKARFATRGGHKIHEMEISNLKKAISSILIDKNDIKILEVGCGTGRLLVEINKAGYRINGVDASTDMLAQCNKKIRACAPNIHLASGEAAQIPYPSNSYDFVYCIRLLNQTDSSTYALNVISDMIRVAKPDGYILVEIVNSFRPRMGRGKYRGVSLQPGNVIEHACHCGTSLIWFRGVFFFGMTMLHIVPDALVDFMSKVDSIFSRLFPRLCARCYILFKKEAR